MSRVLVTGGRGFLGSHLVRALSARGDTVRVLAHTPPTDPEPPDAGLEVVYGDVRDRDLVGRAMAGMEQAIHTVSNFRRAGSDRDEARSVNVDGSRNVCLAAADHGLRRLVHCSTIGVHGSVREVPADERTPFNPGDLYQSTKLDAEREVRRIGRERGLPVTVIRPISIFGPGDRRMLKLFRLIARRRFVMIGDGRPLFQPAYIDDVVQGFLLGLDHERAAGEVFIVGGEEYVPLNELVRLIAAELGVPAPRLRIPLAPVLAAAAACEAICVPLGIEPPLHRRRVSFFRNNRAFRVDKAGRILGFRPRVTLREGIRRTIAWYREQGWL